MPPFARRARTTCEERMVRLLHNRTFHGFMFSAPLLALFGAFVIYPMGFGIYYALDRDSYRALFEDPTFRQTVWNTVLYVGVAVNVKLPDFEDPLSWNQY